MSAPARQLPAERAPERAAPTARRPAARPTPSTPPQRRARRGSTPAFWLLAAVVVSSLVFTVVALNAVVVDTTYRMTAVQGRVGSLTERHDELDVEVARLSSPSRIAEWAASAGMSVPAPGDSVILRVPGERAGSNGLGGGTRA
jgi:cell division protein FtsL